jgi:ABC-type antimicrobial peptide transport system permease subunit
MHPTRLVGGIGIMNILLATVSERTREIGIRRAVALPVVMSFLVGIFFGLYPARQASRVDSIEALRHE